MRDAFDLPCRPNQSGRSCGLVPSFTCPFWFLRPPSPIYLSVLVPAASFPDSPVRSSSCGLVHPFTCPLWFLRPRFLTHLSVCSFRLNRVCGLACLSLPPVTVGGAGSYGPLARRHGGTDAAYVSDQPWPPDPVLQLGESQRPATRNLTHLLTPLLPLWGHKASMSSLHRMQSLAAGCASSHMFIF